MSRKFVISDTHFGHENIIKLTGRPFETVDRMDEFMVDCWNSVVKPNDEVWHLGDFAYRVKDFDYLEGVFRRLHGRKYLVLGNHDGLDTRRLPWASVAQQYVGKLGSLKVHLYHYPIREWDGYWRGTVHLHGHTHGSLPNTDGSMDVGVERLGYVPMDLEDVAEKFKAWTSRNGTRNG